MTERAVVTSGNGFALAEWRDGDREWFNERDDDAFDVDPDEREPLHRVDVHRLVVVDLSDGELIGDVNWHAVGYGKTYPNGAWNVGIGLLPEARGRGAGPVALRLLAEHLFATTDLDRVEASSDIANRRAHIALRKAGFRTEGVLRGAQLRGGERRDMVAFSLLRPELAPAGERTVVCARDGVALATPSAGDMARFLAAHSDSEFDVDRDDRPPMTIPFSLGRLTIVDEVSGTMLGGVSWHAVDYGGTHGCCAWNIGIGLLSEARGRGVGTLAQRLLAEHLFATTDLDRVEATTDVENLAEQRALEKAGFQREGVLRGAQLRGGERHDMAHYGILRGDL
jgi:RimJ/RimL family protein N-acetyltransferase